MIKPGQALYKVGNEPVTLMNGDTPAYRDLNSSDSDGPDILELNRNLVKLGFDAGGIVVDDVWQAATTEGVDLFQESLGETETGDLTLGQVVFLPGNQLVSNVEATAGSDGSAASYDPPAGGAQPEFVSLTKSSSPGTSNSGTTSPGATSPAAPVLGRVPRHRRTLRASHASRTRALTRNRSPSRSRIRSLAAH